jgi:amino acid transporter
MMVDVTASAPQPHVHVTAGTVAVSAVASAPAPTVIIGPSVQGYLVGKTIQVIPPTPDPGFHQAVHTPVGVSGELVLVVFFLVVGGVTVRRASFFL